MYAIYVHSNLLTSLTKSTGIKLITHILTDTGSCTDKQILAPTTKIVEMIKTNIYLLPNILLKLLNVL